MKDRVKFVGTVIGMIIIVQIVLLILHYCGVICCDTTLLFLPFIMLDVALFIILWCIIYQDHRNR